MGSAGWMNAMRQPVNPFRQSTRKPAYLKKPSSPRFTASAAASRPRRKGLEAVRPRASPAPQLKVMEKSIKTT